MALPGIGFLRLLVGKQLQKPLSSCFVIVCLVAQESAKDGDILPANELFQGDLRAGAYFKIRTMPWIQPRTTADFIGSSPELHIGFARTA
jgi:hypothetical protein